MSKQLRLRRQNSVPNLSFATTKKISEDNIATPAQGLKRVTTAVRFMVRLRIAAREWRKQEELRKVLVSRWDEYEKRETVGNTGGTKKPAAAPASAPPAAFVAGGGGFKRPNAPTFAAPAAIVGGGGGFKKPAAPAFSFVNGGGVGLKKPATVAAATRSAPAPATYPKTMDLRERVEMSKRNNNRHLNGANSELDEVESSAAPLGFDVDSSSREREDRRAAVQDWGELDGTEAFSVDSL